MRKLSLIAVIVLGTASLVLAIPAPSISIDFAGTGAVNVSTWTYGGASYVAHFCPNATIFYPNGVTLDTMYVTNYSVADGSAESLDADLSGTALSKVYDTSTPGRGRLIISGTASVATYQRVLRSVYYVNKNSTPTTGDRDVEAKVWDGSAGSNVAICVLTVKQDPNATKVQKPASTPTPTPVTVAQGQPAVVSRPTQILSPLSVDLSGGNGGPNFSTSTYSTSTYWAHICPNAVVNYSGTITAATITLTNRPDGAAESLSLQNYNLAASGLSTSAYNSSTGQLIITGRASSSVYQAVLRSIVYVDTSVWPNTTNRTITVVLSDGFLVSNRPSVTVAVQAPPTQKSLTTPTTQSQGNPTVTQLSGTLLPGSQTTPPPYVDLSGGANGPNFSTWTYSTSTYWAHICPNAVVTYSGMISSAAITLTNRPDGAAESLSLQNYNLAANGLWSQGYNSGTGQLLISGRAGPSVYQAVLQAIVYVDTSASPSTLNRTITVVLSDGFRMGNKPTVTLSVQPPPAKKSPTTPITLIQSNPTLTQLSATLTPVGPATPPYVNLVGDSTGPGYSTWTYGGSNYWAHICPNGTVSYPGPLNQAVISLTNRPDGSSEYLAFKDYNPATDSLKSTGYNGSTGQLLLTGSASASTYQRALRSIVYVNTKSSPNTLPRYITVRVNAGLTGSNLANCTMDVRQTVNLSYPQAPSTAISFLPILSPPTPVRGQVVPTGTPFRRTFYLRQGDDLQKVLNDYAQPGDTIILKAGDTFIQDSRVFNYGYSFLLPEKSSSPLPITIMSSAIANLPPGRRVSPYDISSMPTIMPASPNSPAIRTQARAHNYHLIGLHIIPASVLDPVDSSLVALEAEIQTSEGDLPQDITIDRCVIRGFKTGSAKRGIALNSKNSMVTCCHISGFHIVEQESQAIAAWNGPGPYTITNNYLEAAGQSIIFGGEVATLTNVVPRNILIRDNLMSKPVSWNPWHPSYNGIPWTAKNLLEFKNAQYVTVDHNVFQNCWTPGQEGQAIVINAAGYPPEGQRPWEIVDSITFTNNVIENTLSGVSIGVAIDPGHDPKQPPSNILIRNNLFRAYPNNPLGASISVYS